jgi:hypothetical protein
VPGLTPPPGPSILVQMQRVHISSGKALCRFCGDTVSVNQLSTHIAKAHPRPAQRDMAPKLVGGTGASKTPLVKP